MYLYLKLLNLITTVKTLLPNKVALTGSKVKTCYLWVAIIWTTAINDGKEVWMWKALMGRDWIPLKLMFPAEFMIHFSIRNFILFLVQSLLP